MGALSDTALWGRTGPCGSNAFRGGASCPDMRLAVLKKKADGYLGWTRAPVKLGLSIRWLCWLWMGVVLVSVAVMVLVVVSSVWLAVYWVSND